MRLKMKLFRVKKKLSQVEFAKKIGCSSNHYAKFERGDVDGSVKFIRAIQTAFDIPNADIMELIENEQDETKNDC